MNWRKKKKEKKIRRKVGYDERKTWKRWRWRALKVRVLVFRGEK